MDVPKALARLAKRGTCSLTVRGRKSGKRFTVPIWFAVDGDRVVVETLNTKRNWVRNALATPEVEIEIADLRLRGRFAVVTDRTDAKRIKAMFVQKYWAAWLGSWFGVGPDGVYAITELTA